jgi:hypothetical protein
MPESHDCIAIAEAVPPTQGDDSINASPASDIRVAPEGNELGRKRRLLDHFAVRGPFVGRETTPPGLPRSVSMSLYAAICRCQRSHFRRPTFGSATGHRLRTSIRDSSSVKALKSSRIFSSTIQSAPPVPPEAIPSLKICPSPGSLPRILIRLLQRPGSGSCFRGSRSSCRPAFGKSRLRRRGQPRMEHHLAGRVDPHLRFRQEGKKNADEFLDRGHFGLL